jgi:hypothetical protein
VQFGSIVLLNTPSINVLSNLICLIVKFLMVKIILANDKYMKSVYNTLKKKFRDQTKKDTIL